MFRPQRNKIRNVILAAFFAVGSMFAQPKPAEAVVIVCANCATEITMALQYATAAKQLAQDAQSLYYMIKHYDLNLKNLLSIEVEPDPTLTKEITQIRGFLARAKYFVVSSQSGLKVVLKNDYKHPSAQAELLTPWGPYQLANDDYNKNKQMAEEYRSYLYEGEKDEPDLKKKLDARVKEIENICKKAAEEKSEIGMAQCKSLFAQLKISQKHKLALLERVIAMYERNKNMQVAKKNINAAYRECVFSHSVEECNQKMPDTSGANPDDPIPVKTQSLDIYGNPVGSPVGTTAAGSSDTYSQSHDVYGVGPNTSTQSVQAVQTK